MTVVENSAGAAGSPRNGKESGKVGTSKEKSDKGTDSGKKGVDSSKPLPEWLMITTSAVGEAGNSDSESKGRQRVVRVESGELLSPNGDPGTPLLGKKSVNAANEDSTTVKGKTEEKEKKPTEVRRKSAAVNGEVKKGKEEKDKRTSEQGTTATRKTTSNADAPGMNSGYCNHTDIRLN